MEPINKNYDEELKKRDSREDKNEYKQRLLCNSWL